MVSDDELIARAAAILEACRARGWMLATAESCTGGLIAACLTETAGSSDVVDCGFVTYSNAAKSRMLGVPARMIEEDGAVSHEVARAMAEGAIRRSAADLSVAVTGIAGPGGGSPEKPVGLVHIALDDGSKTEHWRMLQFGDRQLVRRRSASAALDRLRRRLLDEIDGGEG